MNYPTLSTDQIGSDWRAAQALVKISRARGLAALNNLFRVGAAPEPPPNGRYAGELIVLDLAPVLTTVFQGLANLWMPWRGKTFDVSQQRGNNIFTKDSYLLARLFNPLYRGFAFRTYIAPGLFDGDRAVLKIDYNLRENPALTVRRVLDELVKLDDNSYLGKAHVNWWWGGWQTVAYFSLTPP